jgi:hypothetical protein
MGDSLERIITVRKAGLKGILLALNGDALGVLMALSTLERF